MSEGSAVRSAAAGGVKRGAMEGRIGSWLLALLLAVAIFRLWVIPLPSSFWVDETGTAFVVRRGADDPTLRVAPQVPASVYYVLPGLMDRWFGLSEAAYRIPSLAAMAAALWFIARLASRLIHPQAGWLAVFACLLFRGFSYQAADARPYALGTLVFAASLWLLVRWLDTARWAYAAGFAALAALLWRVHLIFWPLYAVYGIYAAARMARKETAVRGPMALAVFGAAGLSLIPVAAQAAALMQEAGAHVIVGLPGVRELSYQMKAGFIASCWLGALAASRLLRWPPPGMRPAASSWWLIAAWWLVLPLSLFAFSWLTGHSVFVSRYLYLGLPGAALTAVSLAAIRLPEKLWGPVALAAGLAAVILLGQWNSDRPRHHNSDWRSASQAVTALVRERGLTVACPSPYIEAKPPGWRPDYPVDGFLYSHLFVYPVEGAVYPLPYEPGPESEAEVMQMLKNHLEPAGAFLLYGSFGGSRDWADWLEARMEPGAWTRTPIGDFGDVGVILLERTGR